MALFRKKVPDRTIMQLLVRAGGRCEFRGCNKFVMEEVLTLHKVRVGHVAHIVGARPKGPRGDDEMPLEERSRLNNLMLLCTDHHTVVDRKELERDYSTALLRQYKADHEDLIHRLTDYKPEGKTTVVRLRCKIGGESVSVSEHAYRQAILPRYPADLKGIEIDLTSLPSFDSSEYWGIGAKTIMNATKPIWEMGLETKQVDHVSVFGLAPIPLLVFLGSCLTNKVPATLYQRHRDDESWTWKSTGVEAAYSTRCLKKGADRKQVGLILSLSGSVDIEALPRETIEACSVYEVRLASAAPNTGFLRQLSDLHRFVEVYHVALGQIREEHPTCSRIHLFPAVPAPVAVACGRELLTKAHPSVVVYDFDKRNGSFRAALEVN